MPKQIDKDEAKKLAAQQRHFPRYDVVTAQNGYQGYAAFLIDHDTGDTWIFDRDLKWKPIIKSKTPAKASAKNRKPKPGA
jgi:hypothetical protein